MTSQRGTGVTGTRTSFDDVHVVDDVPQAFAQLVVDEIGAQTVFPGTGVPFVVVLSGGPTARQCYEELASRADEVPWPRLVVLLGDERCVSSSDPDSNQRLVREALLDRVPPIRAFVPFGPDDAGSYQRLLAGGLRPDLVHLGLGPDGHTASLFPHSAALAAPPGCFATKSVDPSGRNPHTRLTLTLAAIDRARMAVFTVAGTSKAPAFDAVRAGRPVPGRLVRAERTRWLIDHDAARSSTVATSGPAAPGRAASAPSL